MSSHMLAYLLLIACHVHLTACEDVFHSQKYQQSWPTVRELLTEVSSPAKQISTSPGGFTQWAGGREQQYFQYDYVYVLF